jgi:hypothetical protein
MHKAQWIEASGNRKNDSVGSDRWNVVVVKIFAPVLWTVAAVGLFGSDPLTWRFVLATPLLAIALFHLSLAIVRVRNGRVSYCRFFRWTDLEPGEVVSSGVVWPPMIGFIRLRRRTSVLGRIYFVLDKRAGVNPFKSSGHKLLGVLESYKTDAPQEVRTTELHENRRWSVWLKLFVGFCAGTAISIVRISFEHESSASKPVGVVGSTLVDIFGFLSNPPIPFVLLCSLVGLSVFMRHRDMAWTIALLAGLCVPFVLVQ